MPADEDIPPNMRLHYSNHKNRGSGDYHFGGVNISQMLGKKQRLKM